MKKLLLSAILLCGIVMFTMAGPILTRIIPPNTPAVTVNVANGQVLHILTYQSEAQNPASFAQLTIGGRTTFVANSVHFGYPTIPLDLAGPATVTFGSGGSNTTISYSVDSNM